MIYVIKKKDGNILISSFLPLPVSESEDDNEPVLYIFNWNYLDLLPEIRYYVVDPRIEICDTYTPEVIDFLESIKDLPEPPRNHTLKRIYGAADKINSFLSDLEKLMKIGIIGNTEIKQIDPSIIYEIDLDSQLHKNYSADIINLVKEWRSLGNREKGAIEEIYRTGNLDKKKSVASEFNIPSEFLPISLKIQASGKNELEPEYKSSKILYPTETDSISDLVYKYFKPGETISSEYFDSLSKDIKEKHGKTIKISDLYRYFEITRVSRKNLYKIIKKLC